MPRFEHVRVVRSHRWVGVKWEFTTVARFADGSSVAYEDEDDALARLSEDGWELVTATLTTEQLKTEQTVATVTEGALFFKRPVGD